MARPCRIEMLGGLRVLLPDRTIERFQTQKTGALLAYLALNLGKPQPREELAERLWPDGDPVAIRNRLNQAVSSLRRELHRPDHPEILKADFHRLWLEADLVATDVRDLLREIRKIRDGEGSGERVLELYRGEFLRGWYEEWVFTERLRLSDLAGEAIREYRDQLADSDLRRAIEVAHRVIELDSLEESSHLALVELYQRADRPHSAKQALDAMERALAASGISMPSEAEALRRRISPARTNQPDKAPSHGPNPFFGRGSEIAQIESAISCGERWITITGLPGSGKTRLAHEVVSRFLGPTQILSLAVESCASSIWRNICLATEAVRPEEDLLLLLDDADTLVGSSRVREFLETNSNVIVLATAKGPLGVVAERILTLGPLPVPPIEAECPFEEVAKNPAVALFVSRATAVRTDFELGPRTIASVVDLCLRLDGLPLAIELAAGWASALTPAQMCEQISQRYDTLASRRRDVEARHRSIRAALDESFALLDAEARETFVRLAVFEGGWTLPAARHVCPGVEPLVALATLVERALITLEPDGEIPRYRMLDTLRAFAGDHLTPDLAADRAWLHADYYRRLATLSPSSLDGEEANLRAALAWFANHGYADLALRMAIDLAGYWEASGRLAEGRGWLERLKHAAPPESKEHADVHAVVGRLSWLQGEHAWAVERLEHALREYRLAHAEEGALNVRFTLQLEAHRTGDYAREEALLHENLELAETLGNRNAVSRCWLALGNVAVERLAWDEARLRYERSLEIAYESGDSDQIGQPLNNLGNLAALRGEIDLARRLVTEGLGHFRRVKHRWHTAMGLVTLARVELLAGQEASALPILRDALKESPEEAVVVWRVFLQAAFALARLKRGVEAARLIGLVERLLERAGGSVHPVELQPLNEYLDLIREQIGDEALRAERAHGRLLTRSSAEVLLLA